MATPETAPAPAAAPGRPSGAGRDAAWRTLLTRYRWEAVLLVAVVAVFVAGAATQPGFTRPFTIGQMIAGTLEIGLIGIGVAMLMIVAEIDISVSSVMALAIAVLGVLFQAGVPMLLAIVAVLVLGALVGGLNGLLTLRLQVPSLVTTIAALALYRGLAYVIVGSTPIAGFPAWFTALSSTRIGGVLPLSTLVYLAVLLAAAAVIHLTKTGRRIYTIGASEPAARYAGVRTGKIKIWLFVLSSVIAALAGVLYASRLASSSPDAALGFELYAVTVALLGGLSVFGGRGTIVGVLLATLLIMEVRALLGLFALPGQMQDMAVGGLLVAVALVFSLSTRRSARS